MEWILYQIARGLIALIRMLPLTGAARLGRFIGGAVYTSDLRHRKAAIQNLTDCFGKDYTRQEIRNLARENFKRIGENFTCAVKTSSMSAQEIQKILEVKGSEKLAPKNQSDMQGRIIAIGHFGNFELYARANQFVPGFQFATTFRALRQKSLNKLLLDMRQQSGCLYFERRTDEAILRHALTQNRMMLGLLVDQHAGLRGLPIPFFGRECSTSAAPAIYAKRYHCPLHVAICYRIALGRWMIEIGDEIPTMVNQHPRSSEDIALEINQQYEMAIRRDPTNWFWVHRRWKPLQRKSRQDD